MLIKVKRNWKDLVEPCKHPNRLSRRDFLAKGMATGALSVALHQTVVGGFIRQAMADTLNCPAPVRSLGAIAQIFAEGGPTMGARFISDAQASMMNAGMAANYGISGQANLVRLGPNLVVDATSPFGFTLMAGPPGYAGGAAAWQKNVLSKVSGGGHLGPFNMDDGAGVNSGLIGGVSPFKASTIGKDIKFNTGNTPAPWAGGLPSSAIGGNFTPASLANIFSLTPPAAGLTSSSALTASTNAANSIAQAMSSVFNNSARKGAAALQFNAGCAFYGNSALADPTYGATLFNPANVSALSSYMTVGALTPKEQALVAAYYQSASGVAGGVMLELNGRDYHGQSPQNNITPADIEDARAIVMWLAGCDAAKAKGSMIYLANGQAVASGTTATTATINGATANLNCPTAQGDAGGSYNAGLIIFFDPAGSPPPAVFTGTVTSASGNAKSSPNVASTNDAVAGLYLSALKWVNGSIPNAAVTAMNAAGAANNPSNVTVI